MFFSRARGVGWPGWAGDNYFYFLRVLVVSVWSGWTPHLLLLSPLLNSPCCAGLFIGVTLLPHFKILVKKNETPNFKSVSAKSQSRGISFCGSRPGKKSPRGEGLSLCPAPSYGVSLVFLLTFTTAPLMGSCQPGILRRMLSVLHEIPQTVMRSLDGMIP